MTKRKNEKSGSRQSVFERLGGKSSSKTIVYCSAWLKTGTCPNGKSCKYVSSHINLSGSGTSGHNFKSKMKPHSSGKNKDRSGGSPAWDNWDQADLEYADEKVLEKRLELLRRELLNAEVKTESHSSSRTKHHSRSKHKVVEKKRKASTSSSSSSSSSSQSSSSSSSSSSEEEAQSSARFKHAKPRQSPSSSPSPTKHKPRSFQKHNKEKRVASPEKKARNPKAFGTSKGFQKSSPVKGRHRTPPPKRKASPVKQSRTQQAIKKDKGRSAYSPPPHKRDRKSHSPAPRRANDKKPHPRTPPHRMDNRRKSPPVRGGDNRRTGNTVARKSPPLRRNIDNRNADRGKQQQQQQQKNVKGRFDKNNKDDNRRNVSHDKRDDDRMRERIRVEVKRDIRRESPSRDKKREIDNRRDKDRDIKTRQDRDRMNDMRRHKEPDRFAKTSRSDPQGKQSSHPPGRDVREGRDDRRPPPSNIHSHPRNVNSARTPAQGRILDRILERKQYLTGDREKEKDRPDKGLRDRGLDRVHSEHRSRAGSREGGYEPTNSGPRGRDEPTRFPSDERSPSLRHPDDRRPWVDTRRGGSYDEGEEEWEGRKWGGRGANRRTGAEWDRNKDWGPGEWNDGLEWPTSGRPGPPRPGRGGASKREMKEGRSGEDLEEVLSDISDDADEILNRDEEAIGSESPMSDDEPDFKMSTLICGPMQDPLTQRLLADDFDLDFEDASDEDLETKAATIGDALGVDWASLVQETKPQNLSQEETGSAKKRWEPAQIFARLGLSDTMAGRETVDRIKAKYGLDGSSNSGDTQQDLDSAPVLLHSMPGIHCALRDKIKARRQMFDPLRRALHARHDLSIRKQVAGFPVSLLSQTAAIAS